MNRETRLNRTHQWPAREQYQIQYNHYIEEQFTYSSHLLVKRICESGQKTPDMYMVPLDKILIQVVKVMMMNELQILFLGSTLQQMLWNVTDSCLNEYIQLAMDITPKLLKDKKSQRVQLSLILIAHFVKINLNEQNSAVNFKICDIVKTNFDRMYQGWRQKMQNNFKQFNPKNINRFFQYMMASKKEEKSQIVDYNKIVAQFFKQYEGQNYQEKVEEEPSQYRQKKNQAYELPFEQEQDMPNINDISLTLRQNIVSGVGRSPIEPKIQSFRRETRRELQMVKDHSFVSGEELDQ